VLLPQLDKLEVWIWLLHLRGDLLLMFLKRFTMTGKALANVFALAHASGGSLPIFDDPQAPDA